MVVIQMPSRFEQYKIDNKGRYGYFYGRAGTPRLVARTSTNRWSEPQRTAGWNKTLVQTRKNYLPVIEAEIISR
ncbi:hypothetical protein F4859DRAFT_493502 [Xylaria cf. heliscus]|nr:hypothetical protein F4859DRAFT_493502 [Xylaria cf. heliscus]